MAETQQDDIWPVPQFYFRVRLGDKGEMVCQEIVGLDSETDMIAYRHGNSPVFSMPGVNKTAEVTLKKGTLSSDAPFLDYLRADPFEKLSVTIQLLDESEAVTIQWTLDNAYPVRLSGTDLNSEAGEIAIDEIVLAHEGLTIKNG